MEKASLPVMLKSTAIKNRFTEILGDNAASFISSILTIFNGDEKLRQCEPNTILTAAAQMANLGLLPQLGQAYIIPYYNYKTQRYEATFQLGYKGLIQLAMRSNLFRNINATEIYEGEIKKFNRITGEIEYGEQVSEKIIGYAAYIKLTNGFEKILYMTVADIENHAKTFSETYRNEKTRQYSTWTKNFNAMGKKTVLKKLLATFAPISVKMKNQEVTTVLQAETAQPVEENITLEPIDVETGELLNVEEIDSVESAVPEEN